MNISDASAEQKAADWARARVAYESEALSLREVGRLIGVSHEAVRCRVRDEGWTREDAAITARDTERRANAQAAVAAIKADWMERRAAEAAEAGASARIAREHALASMSESDPQMTRAAAVAYGIFVDKAQLLSGGVTARTETNETLDAEIARLVDELRDEVRAEAFPPQ